MIEAPDETSGYASPACLLHELDPAYRGYWPAAELAAFVTELRDRAHAEAARIATALPRVQDDAVHAQLRSLLAEQTRLAECYDAVRRAHTTAR